jgi:hypothetical protein
MSARWSTGSPWACSGAIYSNRADNGAGHRGDVYQRPGATQMLGPAAAFRYCSLTFAPGGVGDAEIHDGRLVVIADHDVGGLEVTVNDASVMRAGESSDDAASDLQRSADGQCGLFSEASRGPSRLRAAS